MLGYQISNHHFIICAYTIFLLTLRLLELFSRIQDILFPEKSVQNSITGMGFTNNNKLFQYHLLRLLRSKNARLLTIFVVTLSIRVKMFLNPQTYIRQNILICKKKFLSTKNLHLICIERVNKFYRLLIFCKFLNL